MKPCEKLALLGFGNGLCLASPKTFIRLNGLRWLDRTCGPKRRDSKGYDMEARCGRCGKRIYDETSSIHAALSASRCFGRPFRIYRCPVNPRIFHLTTKPSRSEY